MQGDLDMDTDEYQPLMNNNTPSRNRPKGGIRVNPVSPASDEVLDDEDTAVDSTRYYSVNSLTRNFYATSLAFSLNMGCATCCVTYATSLLGKHLGSVSSGLLFGACAVQCVVCEIYVACHMSYVLTLPAPFTLRPQRCTPCRPSCSASRW